jgi:hypothetical protein
MGYSFRPPPQLRRRDQVRVIGVMTRRSQQRLRQEGQALPPAHRDKDDDDNRARHFLSFGFFRRNARQLLLKD